MAQDWNARNISKLILVLISSDLIVKSWILILETAIYWCLTLLILETYEHMGESFQDLSWIQDFEADFP